jgi:N-methylhydantoinase B
VSVDGACRDYGVVVGDGPADTAARTEVERSRRRAGRLGGRTPRPVLATPLAGRRMSSALVVADGRVACRRCGTDLCAPDDDVKHALVCEELPVGYRWPLVDTAPGASRFVFRRFHCPGCAAQVDCETNLTGAPFIRSVDVPPEVAS